jgi:putative membrane protein
MTTLPSRGRVVLVLAVSLAALAAWAGWAPLDRGDWLLENALTVLGVALLAATYQALPLSRLSYGLIFLFLRIGEMRGFWGYFLPLDVTMSSSMLYELVEWAAALAFGGGLGAAFLGSQGDPWDAQKDMALASLGALLSMGITAAVDARFRRDFAREFVESLRVKDPRPRGEEELARRLGGT